MTNKETRDYWKRIKAGQSPLLANGKIVGWVTVRYV